MAVGMRSWAAGKKRKKGLAVGMSGANVPQQRAGAGTPGHEQVNNQGIRSSCGRATSKDFQMEQKPNHSPAWESNPQSSQVSRPHKSSLHPTCPLLGGQRKQSPWGVLVLARRLFLGSGQPDPREAPGRQSSLCGGAAWEFWVRGSRSRGSTDQGPMQAEALWRSPQRTTGPCFHLGVSGLPLG